MNTPTHLQKRALLLPVPFDVLLKLLTPIVYVRFGQTQIALRASMPEAPVDEDCQFPPRKGNVRSADVSTPISIDSPMESVPRKASGAQYAPDN